MPVSKDEWKKIAYEFEKQWNFPHCLGALGSVQYKKKKQIMINPQKD